MLWVAVKAEHPGMGFKPCHVLSAVPGEAALYCWLSTFDGDFLPNKNRSSRSIVFTVTLSTSNTSKLDLLLLHVSVLENQIIWCVCFYSSRINLTSSISRCNFIEVNAVVLLSEFLDLAINLCCLLKRLSQLHSVQSHTVKALHWFWKMGRGRLPAHFSLPQKIASVTAD